MCGWRFSRGCSQLCGARRCRRPPEKDGPVYEKRAEAQICQNICVVPKIMETRVDFAELCEKGEEYWSCPEPDCG